MRPLQSTLHDVGKLVDHRQLKLGGHEFRHAATRLAELGLAEPQSAIWKAVFGRQPDEPRTRDGLLVKLADHSAASFRAYELDDLHRDEKTIANTTVRRLWAPRRVSPLTKLATEAEFRQLMGWLATDPTDDDFLNRYGEQLRHHPEDQSAPLNTVSLDTHLRLVKKFCGFYDAHVQTEERGGQVYVLTPSGAVTGVKNVEAALTLRLIRGKIRFGQEPARTRDLAIFQARGEIGRAFSSRDEVLLFTIDQFIAILPVRASEGEHAADLSSLLQPWTDAGFEVALDEVRLPLLAGTAEAPAPSIFRGASPFSFRGPKRTAVEIRSQTAVGPLPDAFDPPICEVCQLEPGAREWPRDWLLQRDGWCVACRAVLATEDWPPPIDHFCDRCRPKIESHLNGFPTPERLGERCFSLRGKGTSLQQLNKWTDDPGALVAWLRISLDLDAAEQVLRQLYRDYARSTVRSQPPRPDGQRQAPPDPDVRFSLVSEFVRDYHQLLTQVGLVLNESFGPSAVEPILPQGVNNVWCVRLQSLEDIFKLLGVIDRWTIRDGEGLFPELIKPTSKAGGRSPIRAIVTASAAKYPFAAHWRQMEHVLAQGRDDVYVRIIGKGEMHLAWHTLGQILPDPNDMRRPQRRAWHNLAAIAQLSDDLARLRMFHQAGEGRPSSEDKTFSEGRALLTDGISFDTLVTALKLLEP